MTLNHFLEAVAAKLKALWPDRMVYADQIPRDSGGAFFVEIIDTGQSSELDRRRRRTVSIEIRYMLSNGDTMTFQEWVEAMYDNFEHLTVKETADKTRSVRLENISARPDEGMFYQFLFDVDFTFVIAPGASEPMEKLVQKEIFIYER